MDIAIWFIIAVAGLGGLVLFAVLQQHGDAPQSATALVAGGSIIVFASFLGLPWISIRGGITAISDLIRNSPLPIDPSILSQLEVLGVFNELEQALQITGWTLTTYWPTPISFQAALFMGPASAVMAVVLCFLVWSQQPMRQPIALLVLVTNFMAFFALFFSFRRIRALGTEPGLFVPIMDLLGINLGPGVWLSITGLGLISAGAFVIFQAPPSAKGVRVRSRQRRLSKLRRKAR